MPAVASPADGRGGGEQARPAIPSDRMVTLMDALMIRGCSRELLAGSQSKQLTACEEKRPRAVNLRLLWSRVAGLISHPLNVADHAAWLDRPNHGRPSPADGGLVLASQQTLIHAPGKRVREEACPAGLRDRAAVRIEQADMPITIRSLQVGDSGRHLLEESDETPSAGIVRRQVLQHACETRKHPPITATPEDLLPVGFALIEESAIAVEQSLSLVVQVVRCLPPEPLHEIHIPTVAGGTRGEREGWRGHEQRVAPDPFAHGLVIAELERLGERRLQHLTEARQGRLNDSGV